MFERLMLQLHNAGKENGKQTTMSFQFSYLMTMTCDEHINDLLAWSNKWTRIEVWAYQVQRKPFTMLKTRTNEIEKENNKSHSTHAWIMDDCQHFELRMQTNSA